MAIEWLAGNRLKGTTAERPNASLQSPSVGGWVEVARTTLGSDGTTIDVSSIPDKRYYMILWHTEHTGSWNQPGLRLGNSTIDPNSNYAERYSFDGGSDSENSPNTYHIQWAHSTPTKPLFGVNYLTNLSAKEKLGITHTVDQRTAGSGNSPSRAETVYKWTNTNNVLDRLELNNKGSGDFISGSEVVVLGWNPDDSHTSNFFEELASVTSTSASDTVDTGSFSQRKYLWIQIYNPAKPTGGNTYAYFNNVTTGTTHSGRSNTNGLNPSTGAANSDYELTGSNGSILNHDPSDPDSGTTPMFTNMFVINISDKEKLSIVHSVSGWSSTTGAGQVPARYECVGKWAKTDQAITSVQCGGLGTNGMGAGSIIKVWGAN